MRGVYVTNSNEFTTPTPVAAICGATRNLPETRLKQGVNLFHQGDRVHWIYQVKTGVVRLTRLLENGRRQVIAFGYPGDIVGFPLDGQHHTDCEGLSNATLQRYRRSALEDGDGDPQMHRDLLQAALREISAMQDHFMMLGRKSALEKVASFICVLTDRVGQSVGNYKQVSLPMSRSDIADFLGLTTETVSRSLTQLRKRKAIAIDNIYTIVILRPDVLRELSLGDHD